LNPASAVFGHSEALKWPSIASLGQPSGHALADGFSRSTLAYFALRAITWRRFDPSSSPSARLAKGCLFSGAAC